ncbi:MAG: hypothetical protein WC415_06850 [Patescibacteria group bacterium]|jgi:hypothetical protein
MHLITTFFKSNSENRNEEYYSCLKNNSNNKFIKSINILSEDIGIKNITEYDKVNFVNINTKPTFRNLIDYANEHIMYNEIVIISNADIYFDDTLECVTFEKDYAYCLSRWHTLSNNDNWFHEKISACYDTWILKTPIIVEDVDFCMGVAGCDSRISYQFFKSGYLPINPSFLIKCYHLHISNLRTWDMKDILCGEFLGIDPSDIIQYLPSALSKYTVSKNIKNKIKQSNTTYDFFKKNV